MEQWDNEESSMFMEITFKQQECELNTWLVVLKQSWAACINRTEDSGGFFLVSQLS